MSVDFHVSFLCYMVRNDNVLLKAVIFIFYLFYLFIYFCHPTLQNGIW